LFKQSGDRILQFVWVFDSVVMKRHQNWITQTSQRQTKAKQNQISGSTCGYNAWNE